MRKEFEEKEKSTSEENIRTSVEDMTDEEFQKFLEEQYIKEAEERQKELFADQDFEDLRMTDKEIDASYAKFVERLKAEGLYEEDTEESDTENPENLSAEEVKVRIFIKVRRKDLSDQWQTYQKTGEGRGNWNCMRFVRVCCKHDQRSEQKLFY